MTVEEIQTDLPIGRLLTDHLDRQALERPEQEFVVLGDRRITYADAKVAVDEAARALIAAGVSKGDRVALLSAPRPEFFLHHLAVTSVGAIWVGLNPKYTSGELDHIVSDAEPSLLFGFGTIGGEDQREKLAGLMANHSSIESLVLFDAGPTDEVMSWGRFLAGSQSVTEGELTDRRASIDTMDPAYLVYTSGSTGRPKGALLTHRGSNICNAIAIERKGLADRRIICNLPINHVGAIGDICGRTLVGGGTLFFQEQFDPAQMLKTIEEERLNTLAGVPTMLQMCVNHPNFEAADLSSIDLIAWGGAAMPAELVQALFDKTGATRATMGYGMTEVTGGVTYSGLTDSVELLATTVGTPDERQEFRVWHPDGRLAERDEPGEIQARGDYVMVGYWRQPEATAAAFTDDGWFKTGDLAVWRSDNYVQIVGRMSEMFKSGGYNVYPREVELALEEHPAVSMAAVISIADETFQEVGVAYVMGSEAAPTPDELRAFAKGKLAGYKVPKQIFILDELPMLPIGKVDKKALQAEHTASDNDKKETS